MKINKLALAFIMLCTIAAPLLAENDTRTVVPNTSQINRALSQNIESDAKCSELLASLEGLESQQNTGTLNSIKELNLTKEDLTENKICKSALTQLISVPEFHKEKYVEIAEITDYLSEIAGGIDNLRVEFKLSPEGNWFRGSLLAYWFWADYVTPQRNLHYAYYLIGKGASKQEMMQVYQESMSIKKFVRNYGSQQAKELIEVMAK